MDLTTLSAVKAWLNISNTDSDAKLSTLIAAWSRAIMTYVSIPSFVSTEYTDRIDGFGSPRILLKNFPVTEVKSLKVNGTVVPPADPESACPQGFLVEPWTRQPPGRMQALDVFGGYFFYRGRQNIAIVYQAGFRTDGEAAVIPGSPFQLSAAAPYGPWAQDEGVEFDDGTALVRVDSSPSAGQYAVAGGQYTFASADAARAVRISYSFIPADVSQAATALVGEDFRYKDRVGEVSKSLGGQESVSYSQADIPARYKTILNQYRNVVPV